MKIFDTKNPKHVQILKEELSRARRILREYNEADIWKRLTVQQREELLSTVDDDMGPDFADEYAETDWLQIPDTITNRINLSKFTSDYARSVDKSALTFARGIFAIIFDEARFKNTKQLQDFIAKITQSKSIEPESLKMALMQYARDNSAKMMDLNIKTQRMAIPTTPYIGGGSGETKPSRDLGYMGGAEWTGDQMQQRTEFIALMVVEVHHRNEKTEPELRFINRNHIMQVWQEDLDIIIELSDYGKLKIQNENIYTFMDRFI